MHVPARRMTRFRRVNVPPRHTHARRAGPHVSHTNIQTKSRESHMLCLLTGIPLAPSVRQRVLVPQSPPSPQMRAGGGSVFFMPPKPRPPLPQERVKGASFSHAATSLPLQAPLPCVNAPSPCMPGRHPRVPGQPHPCVPGQCPHTLRQHPAPARWVEAPGPVQRANAPASAC